MLSGAPTILDSTIRSVFTFSFDFSLLDSIFLHFTLKLTSFFDQVFTFLSPGWEADKTNVVERAVSAVSHDIQRSVKNVSSAVTAMPSNIVRNVDNAFDGISKALPFQHKDAEVEANNTKVGASIDADHDNIPLRITLLLIDEVFDLKDKNIWLRRQMITVLRQIVKTMFGDTVNKRIVDYFATFTAPEAVAGYLNTVKDQLWPGKACLGLNIQNIS